MKTEYSGRRFQVQTSTQDGHLKEIVLHPGAVVILPILDNGQIVMIKNVRFAVNESLWELPAGTLEKGEQPIQTAHRELIEETGYESKDLKPLLSFYSSPGFCDEILHTFSAQKLTFVGQHLEETENIEVFPLELNKILEMIKNNQIKDAKTIATILFYKNFYLE